MMRKIYLTIFLAAALFLTSCASWDLLGIGAAEAFERVMEDADEVWDEEEETFLGWQLYMPGADTFLFLYGDYWPLDIALAVDYRPFRDAGFAGFRHIEDGIISPYGHIWIGASFEIDAAGQTDEMTPRAAFEQILSYRPELIAYHDTGHHYMLHFGDSGHMIMFARDISTQEAGMVFMLNPQPFINAGVDVRNVSGWHFGPHETMTIRGQNVTMDFLVKTFDLR